MERTGEPDLMAGDVGVAHGVPMSEYLQWPGVGQTNLKDMACPAVYRYRRDHPRDPSPAMKLGTAIHTAVLEPEKWKQRYVQEPQVNRRTKAGKEALAEAEAAARARGQELISRDDYEVCSGIATAMYTKDRGTSAILRRPGATEVSFQWVDEATGILCKGRADRVLETAAGNVVCDLKSTVSALPRAFEKSVSRYGYDIQAAYYCDGLTAATGVPHQHFIAVAFEKHPPFASSIIALSPERIEQGRQKYIELLQRLATCREADLWPDYSGEIHPDELTVKMTQHLVEAYHER